jgi:hypothetical protein
MEPIRNPGARLRSPSCNFIPWAFATNPVNGGLVFSGCREDAGEYFSGEEITGIGMAKLTEPLFDLYLIFTESGVYWESTERREVFHEM